MKKVILSLAMINVFSLAAVANQVVPEKCLKSAVKHLIKVEAVNVCGGEGVEFEDETNTSFMLTATDFAPADPEGLHRRWYKNDSQCGYEEVDDGLPGYHIEVQMKANGDCTVVKAEDWGV